mmetsp:Transcript_136970/g.292576  ORF Transcript_136970/g.292576 Transcript_136970/m.292576 type:complete len:177 (-) Transcript_136970:47-577(-)
MAIAQRSRAPLGALLAMVIVPWAWGGKTDEEYQEWAGKIFDEADSEAIQKGASVACAFCQIVSNAVGSQLTLNKARPVDERFSEEEVEEVLMDLCKNTAKRVANSMQGYEKDAMMLCRRVVKENASDMMDAASLGEDLKEYCNEQKICPRGIMDMLKHMEKVAAEKKRQEETMAEM